MRSPLLNINRACQTCHKWPETELKTRVETIQERFFKLRNLSMDALVAFIADLKRAREAGRSDEALKVARDFQKRAQFYLDFVEAENSTGFHAGGEAIRILGESINFSRLGQLSLRDGGLPLPSPITTASSAMLSTSASAAPSASASPP